MLSDFIKICDREGYIKPTVYEGPYNLLRRTTEKDISPILREPGIRFETYRWV